MHSPCLAIFWHFTFSFSSSSSRLKVSGTVVRSGMVKMLEYQRLYECAKCCHAFTVSTDMEQGNLLEEPKACPMVGDPSRPCKSTKFVLQGTKCTDYQVRASEAERLQTTRLGHYTWAA